MAAEKSDLLKSSLAILAFLTLFALIIFVASRVGESSSPVESLSVDLPTAAELRAKEAELLDSYGWVDQENGVVRLPISRASELFLEEAKQ